MASASLLTFMAAIVAIVVIATTFSVDLIRTKLRGVCLSISTGAQLLFCWSSAPPDQPLSGVMGGPAMIGKPSLSVCGMRPLRDGHFWPRPPTLLASGRVYAVRTLERDGGRAACIAETAAARLHHPAVRRTGCVQDMSTNCSKCRHAAGRRRRRDDEISRRVRTDGNFAFDA